MKFTRSSVLSAVSLLTLTLMQTLTLSNAQAGVFNLPRFVVPGEFAIGIEPELLMSGGAAVGVNLRYTHGLTDLTNLTGIIGTGGGARQFRFGGALTFDFFPDIDKQPGIGLAAQGLFVQGQLSNSVEITAIPYIHKSFKVKQGDVDPFLAIPVGVSLASTGNQSVISLAIGALFKHNEHLSSVAEFGVGLSMANTYLSGGLVYYH